MKPPRCVVCGIPATSPSPPYCKKCRAILCDPWQRDCWYEHHTKQHPARKVRDVETEKV